MYYDNMWLVCVYAIMISFSFSNILLLFVLFYTFNNLFRNRILPRTMCGMVWVPYN